MVTTGAKGDDDRCGVERPTLTSYIVTHEREGRDPMWHDSRNRLAETCGARDEVPSSNLGRVKQAEAIRADGTHPQVDGGCPRRRLA